jgi:hypothetical protein
MVEYQDTAAYKKATDEQLRHRDALEKEIRQREADKIQREAWRLDAIDRARAQLVPPVGVTGPPRKRGARPKYPWDEMEAKTSIPCGMPRRGLKRSCLSSATTRLGASQASAA